MSTNVFWIYLISINLISGIIFAYDKKASKRRRIRVPEIILHLLELMGGVFINWLFMFLLNHKSSKTRYYVYVWVVLLGCIFILTHFISNHYNI